MSLTEFTHNPTKVHAIQVAKPWKGVAAAVPFAHPVYKSDGRTLDHFRVSNPGQIDSERAYPDAWIVKERGRRFVLSDEDFQYYYGDHDEDSEPGHGIPLS